MRVIVNRCAEAAICRASLASPIAEVCGLLLGHAVHGEISVVESTLGANVSPADPASTYLLDAAHIMRADEEAADKGLCIVGTWHSHPSSPATPSQADAAAATIPSWIYAIVSIGDDQHRAPIRWWRVSSPPTSSRVVALEEVTSVARVTTSP